MTTTEKKINKQMKKYKVKREEGGTTNICNKCLNGRWSRLTTKYVYIKIEVKN